MQIDAKFDGGNIEVVSQTEATITASTPVPWEIQLRIRKDNLSDFYQWFYFRVSGARGKDCGIGILNAAGAAYPEGFRDYRVLCSFDRVEWFRHPTRLEGGVLRWDFNFDCDAVWFAYYVPFSMERHYDMLARAGRDANCRQITLGRTLDGQPLDLLRFSTGKAGGLAG